MNLTDEEAFLCQLAITGLLDVFNRMQGHRSLDPTMIERLILTFGTINTHTSIGVHLVDKLTRWSTDHPGVQARVAAKLRDTEGGSQLMGLDGKPLL